MDKKRAYRRKYHYIYKITRIKDGRYYIGMHSTDDLEDNYFGSGKKITRSIKKYGKESHNREILEHLPDRESLKKREQEIINEERLSDPLCMNLRIGGTGWGPLEASLAGTKGCRSLKRDRKAASLKSNSTKKARGIIPFGGKHRSFTNKTHTTETKIRIGKANAIHQAGEKNSQFGVLRKFVHKDQIVKRVLLSEVDFHLGNGWKLGMKHAESPKSEKSKLDRKRNRVQLSCLKCQIHFEVTQSEIRKNRRFCSLSCAGKK